MIDENYTNLALRQKITVPLEIGDYTDPYHVYAPLTIDFAPCMVAYRCDAFIGQYTCYQPSGSSGRYFTFVGETNAGNNTNGIPVTFYIFGLPTLSDIPTFGMRVNDSTGSPTYHSGLKGLRIVQMVSGDATISVPAGKTYAISPVNPAKSRAITISNGTRYRYDYIGGGETSGAITVGNGVNLVGISLLPALPNMVAIETTPQHLIIDVTGY
ncbi:MAG TPA: hypothetical protein VIR65_14700 [Rhizorhapis sp.]